MNTPNRPRLTLDRLMLLVAVVALLLVFVGLPLHRYHFDSPIRTIAYRFPGSDHESSVTIDTRHPGGAKKLAEMEAAFAKGGMPYRVERSAVEAGDEFGKPRARQPH